MKLLSRVGLLALLAPSISFAATWNVDTKSEIKNALKNASNGDTIIIAAGTYNFSSSDKVTGTKTLDGVTNVAAMLLLKNKSNVTIRGASSSNRPLIQGPSTAGDYVMYLQNANGTTIKDIKLARASKGLVIDRSNNVTVDNIELYNTGTEGLHIRDGSSNNVVKNSYFHDIGVVRNDRGEGVYIGSDEDKWLNYPNQTDAPVYYKEDCDNNLVENNVFRDIGAEAIDEKEGTSFNTYRNNLIDLKWDSAIGSGHDKAKYGILLKGHASVTVENTFEADSPNNGGNNALVGAIGGFRIDDNSDVWGYDHFITNNSMSGDDANLYTMKWVSDGGATYGCNTNDSGSANSVPSNNTTFSKLREYHSVSGGACDNYPNHTGGSGSGSGSSSSSSSSSSSGGTSEVLVTHWANMQDEPGQRNNQFSSVSYSGPSKFVGNMSSSNKDPYVRVPKVINVDNRNKIKFAIQNNSNKTSFKVYFRKNGTEWANDVNVSIANDSNWRAVTVNMSGKANWHGNIEAVRIDAPEYASGNIKIDWIKVVQ